MYVRSILIPPLVGVDFSDNFRAGLLFTALSAGRFRATPLRIVRWVSRCVERSAAQLEAQAELLLARLAARASAANGRGILHAPKERAEASGLREHPKSETCVTHTGSADREGGGQGE